MAAESSMTELKDELRAAGLRATSSRIAVLRQLRQAARPQSHAEVVDALAQEPWDRATIYRNLIDLTGVGLARKVELGDRTWRFSSGQSEPHDSAAHAHFICSECGHVSCLPGVSISAPKRGVPRALRGDKIEIQLRGVCDTCQ